MGEIIQFNNDGNDTSKNTEIIELEALTDSEILNITTAIQNDKAVRIPISELSTLGAGVSSMIPAFNTVTQEIRVNMKGLYRVSNQEAGEVLQASKKYAGEDYPSLITKSGRRKFARLKKVDSVDAVSQTTAAINPSTMLMAAALYSIEKDLSQIKENQKKILDFLELERESEIKANVAALQDIVTNYKYRWDNEQQVTSNHNQIAFIQKQARKDMNMYAEEIQSLISSKRLLPESGKITSLLTELMKKFKFYRLSLYTYALASLMEIMLSGNYKEEYIMNVESEVEHLSREYRDLFEKVSLHLEKLGENNLAANLVKGAGAAAKATGRIIGNIPLVKEGPVDEFLQDRGENLENSANETKRQAVGDFAVMRSPGTEVLLAKMRSLRCIYNHTSQICCDENAIYLLVN